VTFEAAIAGTAALALGACIGSWTATVAVRAARGEGAWRGRSQCDGCGVRLGFAQTVPVLSYIGRAGTCSACGGRIDPTHLAGEMAGAAVAFCAVAATPELRAVPLAALGLALVGAALIDARTRRLPDVLTVLIALLGAGLSALHGRAALVEGVLAAGVGFILMEIVRRGFLWLRGSPALGFGDVKLVAALALWLGAETPWMIVVAAAVGLLGFALIRSPDGRLPFGPSLAIGAWIVGSMKEAGPWPLG